MRAGFDELDLAGHPRSPLALLDCVPGYLVQHHPDPELVEQAFNGLALVVLDADRDEQAQAAGRPSSSASGSCRGLCHRTGAAGVL